MVHLICFRLEIPFLGKFVPKNQNFQFKLKFGTQTNSNMENSMAGVYCFCFRPATTCLGKFDPKYQKCQFRLKCGSQTNSNMKNSTGNFTFVGFGAKYLLQAYLVQKFKLVSSRKNLVSTITHKISETNSSLHVKQHTTRKV